MPLDHQKDNTGLSLEPANAGFQPASSGKPDSNGSIAYRSSGKPDAQAILSDLARAKAIFQLRAIMAAMGAPEILAEIDRLNAQVPA